MMEFMQRLSHQIVDSPEQGKADEDYIVLGEIYPTVKLENTQEKGDRQPVSASGFLNNFFFKTEEINSDFLSDVRSRIRFTYRTRFAPIPQAIGGPSPLNFHLLFRDNPLNTIENAISHPDCFNTDIGWGCMIRTGQSLLANALQIAELGRAFRWSDENENDEARMLSWFTDTYDAPFSIHNFVKKGLDLSNKKPGEWFGPAATSRSIQSLVNEFPECGIDKCFISVSSGDVYEEEIERIFDKNRDAKILLLLGVKLGIDAINEYYWDDIKDILGSSFSVGIAGGRPSSSLYFIGYEENELVYLDPHNPQRSVQSGDEKVFRKSCHTINYGRLALPHLDPSMLIGVLLSGSDSWHKWKETAKSSKIFNLLSKRPVDFDMACEDDMESITSLPNENGQSFETDYVDIKPFSQLDVTSKCVMDDGYQEVKCKKQQIVVMEDIGVSNNNVDIEVEKILVERETIDISSEEIQTLTVE